MNLAYVSSIVALRSKSGDLHYFPDDVLDDGRYVDAAGGFVVHVFVCLSRNGVPK